MESYKASALARICSALGPVWDFFIQIKLPSLDFKVLKTCRHRRAYVCFKASINIKRGTGYQEGLRTKTRPALGLWNQMRVSLEPLAARHLAPDLIPRQLNYTMESGDRGKGRPHPLPGYDITRAKGLSPMNFP